MNGSISGINISFGVYPCALTKENDTGECSGNDITPKHSSFTHKICERSLNSCIRGRKDGYATDDLPERSDCIKLLREQLVSWTGYYLSEK